MAQVDKYKKVSFNGGTILGLVVTFIIIAGLIFLMIPTEKERIYNDYSSQSGNTLAANHNLDEVSLKKLDKIIDKAAADEYIIVYYGATSCSACLSTIGNIVEKTRGLGFEDLYYLNSDEYEDEADIRVTLGDDSLAEKTPEVWVFNGGKLVASSLNHLNEEDVMRWDSFWLEVEHLMNK